MSSEKKEISIEALELVSGGVLCNDWEGGIDKILTQKCGVDLGQVNLGQKTVGLKREQLRPLLEVTDEIATVCGQAEADKVKMYLQDKLGIVFTDQLLR